MKSMKNIVSKLIFVSIALFVVQIINAQKISSNSEITQQALPQSTYVYETVPGDPLNTRIYTLRNGIKVYMSVNKDEPKIAAYIAVRAGSKHDPADATGLAHYFEHMMFKGTPNFGTLNYEAERIYIAQIDSLFEIYRKTTDEKERRRIYRVIDSLSYIASQFAIPNEYDKLMSIIGSTGTNAYTSLEQTVYIENIPSNQFENWARIQADRFYHPVLRLFHTELETIYEEKNMTLTNDDMKAYFALLEGLFPNHPYGTQTVIGSQEHLKNPSMKAIREYHAKYYVGSNMAICLSGDFDPDQAIQIIDKYFSIIPAGNVPPFNFEPAPPITEPIVKEVFGPDAERVYVAFRFSGASSDEADMLKIIDLILMNSAAGLFDINLLQDQKVLEAYSYYYLLQDYSALILAARPKAGQTLEQARDLLLSQIELIKEGKFDEWLIEAIINDLKIKQIKDFQSNAKRASAFVDAFILGIPWDQYIRKIQKLETITREQVIEFAKKNFHNNYVVVYKRTGRDTSIKKIPKNKITPIQINRDHESEFLVQIRNTSVPEIEPKFIDLQHDITFSQFGAVPVMYIQNTSNDLFSLSFYFDMGTQHNKYLQPALEYIKFIGTSQFTAEDLKKEFYRIGCTFDVQVTNDMIFITLEGLNQYLPKAMYLLEQIFSDCDVDQKAWEKYLENTLKKRTDDKKNIQQIFLHLVMYGMYGKDNPITWRLTNKELKATKPQQLISLIKDIFNYPHTIMYYGPLPINELEQIVTRHHHVNRTFKPYPPKKEFEQQPTDRPLVYFVDFETPHTQILMVSRGKKGFDPSIAAQNRLYNEYFGMNMNSIVFQEMREAKGLAYAAISLHQPPAEKDRYYTNIAYIATQFDKVDDAINGFYEILNNMPLSEKAFEIAQQSLIKSIQTQRILRDDIFTYYIQYQKLGLNEDLNKIIYRDIKNLSLQDIARYNQQYIANKPHVILIVGNKKDLPPKTLKKFGKVQTVSIEQIFGY